jgi:hypothetical protein
MVLVWILLALGLVAVVAGFWWSNRGLTDSDRSRVDRDLKPPGGWSGGL